MKFEDTFNELENKMNKIGKLLDESIEASKEGNRFKAHGIAIDAEKVAKEFEDLVYSIEDEDIEQFLQADEEAEFEDSAKVLAQKAETLNSLAKEYAEVSKREDQLAYMRTLKEIRELGRELAYFKFNDYK